MAHELQPSVLSPMLSLAALVVAVPRLDRARGFGARRDSTARATKTDRRHDTLRVTIAMTREIDDSRHLSDVLKASEASSPAAEPRSSYSTKR